MDNTDTYVRACTTFHTFHIPNFSSELKLHENKSTGFAVMSQNPSIIFIDSFWYVNGNGMAMLSWWLPISQGDGVSTTTKKLHQNPFLGCPWSSAKSAIESQKERIIQAFFIVKICNRSVIFSKKTLWQIVFFRLFGHSMGILEMNFERNFDVTFFCSSSHSHQPVISVLMVVLESWLWRLLVRWSGPRPSIIKSFKFDKDFSSTSESKSIESILMVDTETSSSTNSDKFSTM